MHDSLLHEGVDYIFGEDHQGELFFPQPSTFSKSLEEEDQKQKELRKNEIRAKWLADANKSRDNDLFLCEAEPLAVDKRIEYSTYSKEDLIGMLVEAENEIEHLESECETMDGALIEYESLNYSPHELRMLIFEHQKLMHGYSLAIADSTEFSPILRPTKTNLVLDHEQEQLYQKKGWIVAGLSEDAVDILCHEMYEGGLPLSYIQDDNRLYIYLEECEDLED